MFTTEAQRHRENQETIPGLAPSSAQPLRFTVTWGLDCWNRLMKSACVTNSISAASTSAVKSIYPWNTKGSSSTAGIDST